MRPFATSALVERLQAFRARFATALRSDTKPRRTFLSVEAMEDRSVPSVVSGAALLEGGAGSGSGVAGVEIILTPTSGSSITTTSGSDGSFTFGNIGSGSYTVAIDPPVAP